MNPIKHLCNILNVKFNQYETSPSRMIDLWNRVQETQKNIDKNYCKTLANSIPKRVDCWRKAKGKWTKY